MKRIVFDIEADGLIENATKIHCLSYYDIDTHERDTLIEYHHIAHLLGTEGLTVIGHNIVRYDVPMLEKHIKIDLSHVKQIDTLFLSWYLYPKRLIHGLDGWGKDIGIAKPPIEIWKDDGTPEFISKMVHRCSEDVKINTEVWKFEIEYLKKIYSDRGDINKLIGYLSYKAQCAREQEEEKFRVDIEKAKINLEFLQGEAAKKIEILTPIMPRVNIYKTKSKPKVMYKKDGEISELGIKWLEFLKSQNLPDYHNGAIKYVSDTKEGNPTSHPQLKAWLYTLGWIPETFKWVREKKPDGTSDYSKPARKVEQIGSDDNTGLCESVKKLFEKEPRLEELESLFIINNRISYLTGERGNSFLEKVDSNGFIKAEINGLTNTLRFQHKKPIVNLPQIPKLYWKEVRECLIAPDNEHILCGSDMSQLEDQTKRHYMYFHDPEYVKQMMTPGFDSHLDIALLAKALVQEEVDFYKNFNRDIASKEDKDRYEIIKGTRIKTKKVNFASTYGAGPAKLAVTANISLKESTILHRVYWERNKAIKDIVDKTIWKTVDGQKWLWNPVAKLWYTLKEKKDIFSTLNQGTGAYCFDTWVRYCRAQGYKICMQYHDEHVGAILIEDKEKTKEILLKAIQQTNDELKLNIKLDISIDFGRSYADIH